MRNYSKDLNLKPKNHTFFSLMPNLDLKVPSNLFGINSNLKKNLLMLTINLRQNILAPKMWRKIER